MHLPDHIANLNSYSPPSPNQHPFPNIFGLGGQQSQNQNIDRSGSGYHAQSDVDAHVDALLARQLELWTNTDFTVDEDIGPFPGLDEFDDGCEGSFKNTAEKEQKDAQNEDEMDMRDVFEGKVRGMKGSKNVLLDRRREMEMEMERQEKAANRNADAQYNRHVDQQPTSDGSHALASANLAATAAVNGMSTSAYPAVPPTTPSSLGLQNLSRNVQMQQPQQPQLQVNNLESFLSQFYGSNAVSSLNALPSAPQQLQSMARPVAPIQSQAIPHPQQSQLALQNPALGPNQALAESLVHLLQGLTGQQNTQPQQNCPAPAVLLPQAIPESHSMSNVARWIERQDLHETRPPFNANKEANSLTDERMTSQKRPLPMDEEDAQSMFAKKARLGAHPTATEELRPLELHDMPDFARMPSSTAVSASGDSRRKSQNHGTPTRADIDLEPKSIPMGKGLVMVEGEIITHEEE
jgi:hypothetical protein